jgi:cell division protein DivIC
VSLIGQSRTLSQRLAVYDARAAVLKQSIEEETERTQEIQELKEYMQTDAYVEEIAREKLGLVKDNEIVFIEED